VSVSVFRIHLWFLLAAILHIAISGVTFTTAPLIATASPSRRFIKTPADPPTEPLFPGLIISGFLQPE